eukprot:jgi/Chrzof1/8965/Cz03g31070.t1
MQPVQTCSRMFDESHNYPDNQTCNGNANTHPSCHPAQLHPSTDTDTTEPMCRPLITAYPAANSEQASSDVDVHGLSEPSGCVGCHHLRQYVDPQAPLQPSRPRRSVRSSAACFRHWRTSRRSVAAPDHASHTVCSPHDGADTASPLHMNLMTASVDADVYADKDQHDGDRHAQSWDSIAAACHSPVAEQYNNATRQQLQAQRQQHHQANSSQPLHPQDAHACSKHPADKAGSKTHLAASCQPLVLGTTASAAAAPCSVSDTSSHGMLQEVDACEACDVSVCEVDGPVYTYIQQHLVQHDREQAAAALGACQSAGYEGACVGGLHQEEEVISALRPADDVTHQPSKKLKTGAEPAVEQTTQHPAVSAGTRDGTHPPCTYTTGRQPGPSDADDSVAANDNSPCLSSDEHSQDAVHHVADMADSSSECAEDGSVYRYIQQAMQHAAEGADEVESRPAGPPAGDGSPALQFCPVSVVPMYMVVGYFNSPWGVLGPAQFMVRADVVTGSVLDHNQQEGATHRGCSEIPTA